MKEILQLPVAMTVGSSVTVSGSLSVAGREIITGSLISDTTSDALLLYECNKSRNR
jgi:hypothetical protein